jgi:thymidylate synthase
MHLKAETLDDLLRKVYRLLLRSPYRVRSSKGRNREVPGVLLELKTPTARLSRTETRGTVFSCLGETLWYLSGSDQLESIAWYMPLYRKSSDDKRTIYGAYGPRLRLMRGKVDQLTAIIKLLKKKPQRGVGLNASLSSQESRRCLRPFHHPSLRYGWSPFPAIAGQDETKRPT